LGGVIISLEKQICHGKNIAIKYPCCRLEVCKNILFPIQNNLSIANSIFLIFPKTEHLRSKIFVLSKTKMVYTKPV
jgi:hypothetical protein